ncbi:MAG: hypothetical protein WCO26_05840 [Deltaproteobacteria bacterium]
MKKKKSNIYDRHKQRHWEAHSRAPLIKDKFPILASLSIKMTFIKPDWGENPRPRQERFGPESKAFFEVECPYVECISGGFDLSSAVSEILATRGNVSSGTIVCQGWQDRERINRNRCLLTMEYKITPTYIKDA